MTPDRIIESLIFVSDIPVKPASILEVFQGEAFQEIALEKEQLDTILDGLEEKYGSEDFPFELKKIDGGYQFFSKQEYFPFLRHAALLKNRRKLTRTTLETLSIIAYRQPVTRTEVEFVRGVNCDYAIQKLLEKKLIKIKGRADAPGRPLLYVTSPFFMEYFGINDISDMPKLEEFSIDEDEFQEQFKVYIEEKDDLEGVLIDGAESNGSEAAEAPAEESPKQEAPAEEPVAESSDSEEAASNEEE